MSKMIVWATLAVSFLGALVVARSVTQPPSQSEILERFREHRVAFEQLRAMLQSDRDLLRVAGWGIETDSGIERPPVQKLSAARYDQYVALLNEVGAKAATRPRAMSADVCVLVWASGFGGDTRHRWVCWLSAAPGNQITELREFEKSSKPRSPVFVSIGDGWYIGGDR